MKKERLRKVLLSLAACFLVAVTAGVIYVAAAGESVAVTDIDYDNLTLTVKANAEDTKVFFAHTKTATTWDEIPGELDNNKEITMDISWVSASANYILYLKGDHSTEPLKVVLPKQNTKFKASLNIPESTVKFTGMGDDSTDVYWRKSTSTQWSKYDEATFKNSLDSFCQKGLTLYFRSAQKKGTSAEQVGSRPSKTSTLKISKRATAPSVSLNYSSLTFGVKKTMEYKLSTETDWKAIIDTSLKLEDAVPQAMCDAYQTAINDGTLKEGDKISVDFRTKATTSKVASQIKTIEVPGQENTPSKNIVFAYTGSKQCKIEIKEADDGDETIPAASSSNPYEYTVVKDGDTLDVYKAKWSSITSDTVKISSTVAPEKSKIYVRKKATSDALATKEMLVTPDTGIVYPSPASLEQDEKLEKIQGVEKVLSFTVKASTDSAEVSSVTFNGTEAGMKSSKAVKVEGQENTYAITVTINDTSKIEAVADNLNKELKAKITLNNGDTIEKGVTLYIQKAAGIASANYTKYKGFAFNNGKTSGKTDYLSFEVELNDADNKKSGVTVEKISYNSTTLDVADYTVTSATDTERKITVTLPKGSIDKFDNYVTAKNYGSTFSLLVTLSNGEVLDSVKIKAEYPVTVSGTNSSIAISKTAYKRYLESVKAAEEANASDSENKVTVPNTYTDPVVTYTINKDILALDNTYAFVEATWKDHNVYEKVEGSNGTFKVTVDLEKLANLTETGSDSLILELKNSEGEELIVDYGYHITVTE